MKPSGYLAWTYITLAGISGLTQVFPGLVSRPLREYAEEQGLPVGMANALQSKDVRVYSSTSPLQPFHSTGLLVRQDWSNAVNNEGSYTMAVARTVVSPLIFVKDAIEQALATSTPGNAWAFRMGGNAAESSVFMRAPSSDMVLRSELSRYLAYTPVKALNFKTDTATLLKLFKERTVLHEGRHTEQSNKLSRETAESDADLFASNFLRASVKDSTALNEIETIFKNIRAIGGLLHNGDHAGSMALEDRTAAIADRSSEAFKKLNSAVSPVMETQKYLFPADMKKMEQKYYVVNELVKAGRFDKGDPLVKRAAISYIDACHYFEKTCEAIRTDRKPRGLKIDAAAPAVKAGMTR